MRRDGGYTEGRMLLGDVTGTVCERDTQKREKGRGTVRSRTKGESERRRERENE